MVYIDKVDDLAVPVLCAGKRAEQFLARLRIRFRCFGLSPGQYADKLMELQLNLGETAQTV
jgi:hypothetical protein